MDPEFFEAIAMPLFDQLYNFAHWLTGDRSDAEDLVQETYSKALKGFRSFQEGTNLRAWMYRILHNSFLTSRTGLRAHNLSYLDDEEVDIGCLTAHSVTPELLLLQEEGRQTVMDALACVPLHYREVLLLCEAEEMSYKEIAQVLGVPIGTVMSRLARARKLLRELLAAKPTEKSSQWTVIKTPGR
ncbi:MAG: sigma-70 family RNA polymerase sigma factor [Silvibacterium sp.]|nr:sigma-70 family RNA polymerase sigma factor [Silvibacterium sp.]